MCFYRYKITVKEQRSSVFRTMSNGEVCSHVKVVVRVRPLNDKEKDGNFKNVVHVVDNHMLVFDPKEEEVTFFRGQRVGNRDVRKRANKDLKFVFDSVFGEETSQIEVFENTTKAIVDGVLNGYNCTGETFDLFDLLFFFIFKLMLCAM